MHVLLCVDHTIFLEKNQYEKQLVFTVFYWVKYYTKKHDIPLVSWCEAVGTARIARAHCTP